MSKINIDKDRGKFIQTYTGKLFYPYDPQPEDICIEDIAHALSNMCRFTGHCRKFYSVAQHSVLVASQLPDELMLQGLLHDASEAYIVDIPRPLKYSSHFDGYRALEEAVTKVINRKFGLPEDLHASVKFQDTRLLITEKRDLMPDTVSEIFFGAKAGMTPLTHKIDPWSPEGAEKMFLGVYQDLIND